MPTSVVSFLFLFFYTLFFLVYCFSLLFSHVVAVVQINIIFLNSNVGKYFSNISLYFMSSHHQTTTPTTHSHPFTIQPTSGQYLFFVVWSTQEEHIKCFPDEWNNPSMLERSPYSHFKVQRERVSNRSFIQTLYTTNQLNICICVIVRMVVLLRIVVDIYWSDIFVVEYKHIKVLQRWRRISVYYTPSNCVWKQSFSRISMPLLLFLLLCYQRSSPEIIKQHYHGKVPLIAFVVGQILKYSHLHAPTF